MEFHKFVEKARMVNKLYDELNDSHDHTKWELQQLTLGLMEDLGSLSRLVLMKEGHRDAFEKLDEKLKHEVCDCLWATLRIADVLNIDLETEFPKQMDLLAERIKTEQH